MLSSNKIKEVALELFCERGYEGASLADISELVGIKKSSIYNHYKNKDDLFLHIFENSCHEEILHVRKTLQLGNFVNEEQFMHQFLHLAKNRIINNVSARFVFRFTMFPPFHITDVLREKISQFMDNLFQTISSAIEQSELFSHLTNEEKRELAAHYTIILQGTYVEQLTHAFGSVSNKIDPAWNHFSKVFKQSAIK